MLAIHRLDLRRRGTLSFSSATRPLHGRTHAAAPLIVAMFLATLALYATRGEAESAGAYTNEQASRGAAVYTQYCAVCHGANLQGEAGTPLMGRTFLQAYGGGTAAQ